MTRSRILFVLQSLECGGAERVILTLLRHLPRTQCEPHLAVLERKGPFLCDVPDDVPVHDLNVGRVAHSPLKLTTMIRRLRPDVIVSTVTHLNVVVALLRPLLPKRTRLVLRETNVSGYLTNQRVMRLFGLRRIGWSYGWADVVVCQSTFMLEDVNKNLGVSSDKLQVIRNPIDFGRIQRLAVEAGNPYANESAGPNIIGLGSLLPVKGFDRLITSFGALLRVRPNAHLWILGEGPLEGELKRLAAQLGLGSRVHFPGVQHNPFRWLRHADLMVLSSRFESASNVLLEAIACRCPVVTFDVPGGTREIMEQLGLSSRIVTELDAWEDEWFERPDDSPSRIASVCMSAEAITEEYTRLLLATSDRDALQTPIRFGEQRAA